MYKHWSSQHATSNGFFFGSNLRFIGGRQSTVTMVFTRWPREELCTRRKMSALRWFCNILLQGLTPLHVNITRSTNLLSVCRRKLKLSTYLHAVSYNHISFLKTRSQLQTSSQSLLVLWRMVTRFLQVTKFFFEKRTPSIQKKLFSLRRCHFFRFYEFLLLGSSSTAPVFSYNQ